MKQLVRQHAASRARHHRAGVLPSLLAAIAGSALACCSQLPADSHAAQPGEAVSSAPLPAPGPPVAAASPAAAEQEAAGQWTTLGPLLSCEQATAPPAMACIPAGPALLGSDAHADAETPEHEVFVSTFFIDKHEVTNAAYAKCEEAGVCPQRRGLPGGYRPFLAAELPAVPITWRMAHAYCVWAGKRLPTEAEWEKVARGGAEGRSYPWGNTEPTCELANFKACRPRRTRPPGSFAAGAYGVFDLAGNGYEWVKDWASPCYAGCPHACGDACLGKDPQGPCDGAPFCPGHKERVLKGGSWYWPADHLRSARRRFQKPQSGLHRLSFRCATSTPVLARAPLWHLQGREPLRHPEPPSAQRVATARDVRHDTDIARIPDCAREGRAGHHCKDPRSYYKTNERGLPWWRPYIEDLGGGYVGVGADQSYDLIAAAHSRWAWIFDYDPTVVRVHYVIRALVLERPTPQAFADGYRLRDMRETKRLLRASLADEPEEIEPTLAMLDLYRGRLLYHYRKSLTPPPGDPEFGWLSGQRRYDYIRQLFRQGRITLRKGNLLTDVVMPDIAHSARTLGVPVRVLYLSNADDQWSLSDQYRRNLIGLPFDEHSVVLRTVLGKRWQARGKWLYTVHGGKHMQRKLARNGYRWMSYLLEDRLPTRHADVVTIGLPQRDGLPSRQELSQR